MNKIKLVISYIKTEKYIIITLVLLILIGLFCWIGSTSTEQFGLNFLTEMLGVGITVLILDQLIKRKERKRTISIEIAIYKEIVFYLTRYYHFWSNAFRFSVPEKDPETFEDFFSENGMSKIFEYLNLDAKPYVSPETNWWEWLVFNANEFVEIGDKILNRYSYNLDPVAFDFLHSMTGFTFNKVILTIPSLIQVDKKENYPRLKILSKYTIKPEKKDYEVILGLIKWCDETYIDLKKFNINLLEPTRCYTLKNKIMPPPSMITQDILEHYKFEYNQYRKINNQFT